MAKQKFYPMVDKIIAYESGELTDNNEILELFSELLKSGTIYGLQGSYQRTASDLVANGYLSIKGEILKEIEG